MQTLHHQHQVDDVEPGKHKQRRQQHEDHTAIAELRTRLDHLRQAQVRALRTMERHEQGAEHNAQRAGECGPERGQADAWANEADGHGEEGEIAEEPERALTRQFVGALVFRDEVDRMAFDDRFAVEERHAGCGFGVSIHDCLLLLEDHDEITAFFRVNDARPRPCRSLWLICSAAKSCSKRYRDGVGTYSRVFTTPLRSKLPTGFESAMTQGSVIQTALVSSR